MFRQPKSPTRGKRFVGAQAWTRPEAPCARQTRLPASQPRMARRRLDSHSMNTRLLHRTRNTSPPRSRVLFKTAIGCALGLAGIGLAQGIPEPDVVYYGVIRNVGQFNARVTSGLLTWKFEHLTKGEPDGQSFTATVPLGNVLGQFSYAMRIPCETSLGGARRGQKSNDGSPMEAVNPSDQPGSCSRAARGYAGPNYCGAVALGCWQRRKEEYWGRRGKHILILFIEDSHNRLITSAAFGDDLPPITVGDRAIP